MCILTAKELEQLKFDYVTTDGTPYYQYVVNKEDYFNSPYLVTSDENSNGTFEVLNKGVINSERGFLTKTEILEFINKHKERGIAPLKRSDYETL